MQGLLDGLLRDAFEGVVLFPGVRWLCEQEEVENKYLTFIMAYAWFFRFQRGR